MYKALIYRVEGPKSLYDAANRFNNTDHTDRIYSNKSGLSSYIRQIIGKEYSFKTFNDRDGIKEKEQIVDELNESFKFSVPFAAKAIGTIINTILIIGEDKTTGKITPIYMIPLDDLSLNMDNGSYILIRVGKNKFKRG